ncbi:MULTISPECIES: hypothetical protein [unclassified Polaromonas]|uniref:hypothetical protein n=1 Tax=unclassified Polaromonas TaxID=2638319 RepID=UPI001143B5AE|nr:MULTISPECIES: hypothetical protein [unclassified Polaromonas]MDI1272605.1 hypothetical protein [Polaromonas sp.]
MRLIRTLSSALLAVAAVSAWAHGGVGIEDDKCILRIGSDRAHFAGYQPEHRASQEFCEDIPEVGRAVIVIDFIQPALRERVVEFRILRDADGLGAKARYEDLGDTDQIAQRTMVALPAKVYPRGTVTLDHKFSEPGWYIGLLSATDPASGKTETSVFPFRVGVRNYWKYLPLPLFFIGMAWLLYRLTRQRRKPPITDVPQK